MNESSVPKLRQAGGAGIAGLTFSARFTNLTVLPHQSRDSSCYVSRWIVALPTTLITDTRWSKRKRLAHSGFLWQQIMLSAFEAGDIVELILL